MLDHNQVEKLQAAKGYLIMGALEVPTTYLETALLVVTEYYKGNDITLINLYY